MNSQENTGSSLDERRSSFDKAQSPSRVYRRNEREKSEIVENFPFVYSNREKYIFRNLPRGAEPQPKKKNNRIHHEGLAKDTKGLNELTIKLRALRDLRG